MAEKVEGEKRKLRVLVIDDEPYNGDAIKRAFRKDTALTVTSTDSSLAAMDLARRETFDLFFVDYSMAGLTGVEFAEQARAFAPDAVYIMLTGFPELKKVVDAHTRGIVDGILGKPWTVEGLTLTLAQARSVLHLREIRRGLKK